MVELLKRYNVTIKWIIMSPIYFEQIKECIGFIINYVMFIYKKKK